MRAENKFQQRIVEIVQQSWAIKQPCLLAPLGVTLRKEFADEFYAELAGRKFKAYLQSELTDRVRIVQNPDQPIQWGLVPANVDETAVRFEGRKAPVEGSHSPSPSSHSSIKYAQELWLSFSRPIEPGRARIVRLGDVIHVDDVAENTSVPNGWVLISRDDAAKSSAPNDRSYFAISAKIESWAKKHNIDLSHYKTMRVRVAQRSVLDIFLESIPAGDLISISLPMHIVKALNDRKI